MVDRDTPWGWIVAAGAAITGMIGGAIRWRRSGSQERRIEDRTAIRQQWEIIDRQDRQIGEQQKDIGRLYEMNTRCLVREERWYSLAASLVEGHNHMAAVMRGKGMDAPPDIAMPPREIDAEAERAHAGFVARTQQTNATLAQDVTDRIRRGNQP